MSPVKGGIYAQVLCKDVGFPQASHTMGQWGEHSPILPPSDRELLERSLKFSQKNDQERNNHKLSPQKNFLQSSTVNFAQGEKLFIDELMRKTQPSEGRVPHTSKMFDALKLRSK